MRSHFMKTERMGFSVWTPDDLPLARQLWGEPDVTRYISATGAFSAEDIEARLATEIENGERWGIQYWPLFALDTGELLGCCGLRPFDMDAGEYELGFHLMSAHWGRGCASEAVRTAIAYAFDTLGAKSLVAGHHPRNEASGRVLKKLGFSYTGDNFYAPTGLDHPSYRLMSAP